MAWTSPRTWVASEIVTAALLNAHLRDNLLEIGGAWTAYSPSWTATTTNPTIGNGTITGRRSLAGKFVNFSVAIVMGSTTGFGAGTYSISLPSVAVTQYVVFSGGIRDASANLTYPLFGEINAASKDAIVLRALPSTAGIQFGNVTPTNPITLATSDVIAISGTYEAA